MIQYNSYLDKKQIRNQTEYLNKPNKSIMLNLKNLLVFKKQKEYKHYDCFGNNYNYYERNESSERKRIKNDNNNEYMNIMNTIKNETNKLYMRNKYNLNYGYNSGFNNIISNKEYGNHQVYISNNVNYGNKMSKSCKNHKLTNINMNKVNTNFNNIENITDSLTNNNYITFKDKNYNNTKTFISNSNKKNIKKREDETMKKMKSQIIENNNSNNISYNHYNKRNNTENNLIDKKLRKNKSHLINDKYTLSNKSLSFKGDLITPKKKETKITSSKKFETKTIKTNFDYSNKLDKNMNNYYNNINRKEIKYYNSDKNFQKKMNNYNYYNSNQNIINYNLRDKYRQQAKIKTEYKYNFLNNEITNPKEEKKDNKVNNVIIETIKENKNINKIPININYHSTHVNHNFYECKNMKLNQLKIKANNRANNNQIINSYYKEMNDIKIKTALTNNNIRANLNLKFNNMNMNKTDNLLKYQSDPNIQYSYSNKNQNLIKNINQSENIKNIPINNNKIFSHQIKEKNKNEKLNNLKKILKIRRNKSYSPNRTINEEINKKLNYCQSEKILNKIKKEKNDIIKKYNIRKYLTEKNLLKFPDVNKKNKKSLTRNKSYDSIMPPNDLDEIFKKNNKMFKLLNDD